MRYFFGNFDFDLYGNAYCSLARAAVAPLAATPPGGPSHTGLKHARSLDLANVEGTAVVAPPDALPKRKRGPPPGAALEIRREPPR